MRVSRSIRHYGLDITRAAFTAGRSSHEYLPAFNASLFLSANEEDVQRSVAANYAAGLVLPSTVWDDENDHELRVAFDFDGVLADDKSETVFKKITTLMNFRFMRRPTGKCPIARITVRSLAEVSSTPAP